MELVALLVGSVALGVIRPRRTTLLAALVPTALAFAWLVMHEDIPGDPLGFADLAWYAGMSLVAGAAFALAIAAGVAAGRHLGRSPQPRE
jgi:hypothetical protein